MAFSFTWHFRRIPAVNAVVILSLAAVISHAAQMAEQENQKQKDWRTSLNAGLNLTHGNSENMLVNGAILTDYNKRVGFPNKSEANKRSR